MTDVGLEMFRLLVLWNMIEEGGLVRKAFVAGVTFVRLVGLVTPGMGLKVRELGKGFVTTRVPTFVGLVSL